MPTHAGTVLDALDARGAATPERVAFVVGGVAVTFGALATESRTLAGRLGTLGVGPGDRVALLLGSSADFLRALFALQRLRATPVAVHAGLPAEAVGRRVALVRAALALVPEGWADAPAGSAPRLGWRPLTALPEEELAVTTRPGPEDVAYLQLTSGTTGASKAAVVSHRSLAASLVASVSFLEAGADDVFVSWMPLHHDLGLVRFVFTPVWYGARCHLLPPALSSLGPWLATLTREGGTITAAPDFGYRVAARVVDPASVDLSALRVATSGGEPVRLSTIAAFEGRFRGAAGVIRPGYGLAEATLGVSASAPGEPVVVDAGGNVACGRPIPGLTVRIVAPETGAACGTGEVGAIAVRGEAVFSGYLDDPEATAAVIDADGWLATGDVGKLDEAGRLYVLGRTRAMIKRAGALVAPRELEEAADAVSGVRVSAAIGVPGELGTEEVVLVVEARADVAASDADRAALAAAVSRAVRAAVGFAPGEVRVTPPRTIPLTANGKLRHAELRRRLLAGDLG